MDSQLLSSSTQSTAAPDTRHSSLSNPSFTIIHDSRILHFRRPHRRFYDQLQSKNPARAFLSAKGIYSRRELALGVGITPLLLNWFARPLPAFSETESKSQEEDDDGVIGAIKSLIEPNEKTKKGSILPKAYVKSAKEVVKTLRESLNEDPKDNAKFRRTADAAKVSIRDYLNNWKGQKTVVSEKSYAMLEKAIRSLAKFYSRSGPSANLPEEIKQEILGDLTTAQEFL